MSQTAAISVVRTTPKVAVFLAGYLRGTEKRPPLWSYYVLAIRKGNAFINYLPTTSLIIILAITDAPLCSGLRAGFVHDLHCPFYSCRVCVEVILWAEVLLVTMMIGK